jgi:hypothetical protein
MEKRLAVAKRVQHCRGRVPDQQVATQLPLPTEQIRYLMIVIVDDPLQRIQNGLGILSTSREWPA